MAAATTPTDAEAVPSNGRHEARPGPSACVANGRRLEVHRDPLDAVAELRLLPRRYGDLLRRGDLVPTDHVPGSRSPWSVLERTTHICDVVDTADVRLRRLLGEDVQPRAHVEAPRAGANWAESESVLASLTDMTERLVRTITSATAEDWRRARTENGTSASDLVGQVLHEATRHLQDDQAFLRPPAAPYQAAC